MCIQEAIQAACHELEALRVVEVHTRHAATIDGRKRMGFLINPDATLGILYLALNVGLAHGTMTWKVPGLAPAAAAQAVFCKGTTVCTGTTVCIAVFRTTVPCTVG